MGHGDRGGCEIMIGGEEGEGGGCSAAAKEFDEPGARR